MIQISAAALWQEFESCSEAWQHLRGANILKKTGERHEVVAVVDSGHYHPRLVVRKVGHDDDEAYAAEALTSDNFATVAIALEDLTRMRVVKARELACASERETERVRRRDENARAAAYEQELLRVGLPGLVRRRGIEQLIHFTRLKNLGSILRHGIYPRARLYQLPVGPIANDPTRADGRPDAVSLSVTHPNERLFDKWRRRYSHETWVILAVRPDVLWQSDCELFYRNAARGSGHCQVPLAKPRRPSAVELERLFAEPESPPNRAEMGHRDCDTTDPQAEVMLFGVIQPRVLRTVYTETVAIRDKAQPVVDSEDLTDTLPVVVNSALYRDRHSTTVYVAHGDRHLLSEDTNYWSALHSPSGVTL